MIRCINMDKSTARMDAIYRYYVDFEVKRIKGIDGSLLWGDGSVDELDRYNWNGDKLAGLISGNVIAEWYKDFGDARPPEVACSISHSMALVDFYNSNEDVGIIIEDDTAPLEGLLDFEMPNNVDFYCLIGTDHPGNRVATYSDGGIKYLRNLSGYAITKKGAEFAIKAMCPFWAVADIQMSFGLFDSVDVGTILPSFFKRGPLLNARAPVKSIIGLSEMAKETTFTSTGIKKWMPKGQESIPY
jgi:hypothetical protein